MPQISCKLIKFESYFQIERERKIFISNFISSYFSVKATITKNDDLQSHNIDSK